MHHVLLEERNHSWAFDIKFLVHLVEEFQFILFEIEELIIHIRVISLDSNIYIIVSELLDLNLHLIPWVTDDFLVVRDHFLIV